MIRPFIYALILILSAYAGAAAQDPTLAATSPAPNPVSSEKITFTEVNVDGPYIAMTFDDGPHATNTPKLLEMAAEGTSNSPSLCLAHASNRTRTFSARSSRKDMKSAITPGRTLILRNSRTRVF